MRRSFKTAPTAKHSMKIAGAALALGFLASASAHATIIQNGNFETGSLSSWTATGNVTYVGVPFFGEGTTAADGNYFAVFNAGNAAPNGVLSQSFAAVGGTQYLLAYNYGANSGAIQSITAAVKDSLGNVVATQFSTLPAASGTLAPFSLSFISSSTQTLTLSFTDYASNPTNSTDGFLDNVAVTAVPEPSSLAILGVGAVLGFGVIRRKQNQQRG